MNNLTYSIFGKHLKAEVIDFFPPQHRTIRGSWIRGYVYMHMHTYTGTYSA